jgi:hypothetical protein
MGSSRAFCRARAIQGTSLNWMGVRCVQVVSVSTTYDAAKQAAEARGTPLKVRPTLCVMAPGRWLNCQPLPHTTLIEL